MPGEEHFTEERSGFESLLAELTARFINLPSEEVDSVIEDAQRQVCEFLGLDLSALWQFDPADPGMLVMTHVYHPLIADEEVPERMDASEYYPWALEKVMNNEIIAMSSTRTIPVGAERDAEAWHHYGIKTNLTIPLVVGDKSPFGAISFNDMQREREWSERLIRRLKMVAQIFAGAIQRKLLEQELRESAQNLSMVMDAAEAGAWSVCLSSNQIWISARTGELFDLDASAHLTPEDFTLRIHDDDRARVIEALKSAAEKKKAFNQEYRIVLSNGRIRWVVTRGHVRCKEDGTACRLMGLSVDVTERKQSELALLEALAETQKLRDQLKNENLYLREQVHHEAGHGSIIGSSAPVIRMLEKACMVAPTDSSVLITGETGTGKELLAQAVHEQSARKNQTMIKVNCVALPAALIESELFGREKGAYTGAMTRQTGRFEIADGSTIFLDEIGDLPLALQTKLLRVLQDGQFERLGSHKTLHTDVRIIAATNRDLLQMVQEGSFREDLYHRLNIFPIESPPLRDRREDIPELAWRFVQEFNRKMGRSIDSIPKSAMDALKQYDWPGNVRELRNLVERAMIMSGKKTLCVEMPDRAFPLKDLSTLEDVERHHIIEVLEKTQWRIGGTDGAAEALGMARTTLNSRMKKLGITRS